VNEPAVSPDTVIRDADAAMYRAKEHGGDRFELFDETSRHRATERLELEEALRHAMEHGELRVHYQPQVSLAGDTGLSGFEALVRWQHPERGLMDAREFVALAETTGLIVPIGEWVLGQALQEVTRWREQRPDVTVSVNMSARQLADPGLEATLAASLRESGADPATLSLEVTESAVLDDLAQNGATLDSLRRLGVRLTVDDFGTGRTSVQSLRRLPLQEVKIAPSFVRGLGGDGEERALLGALVELGHALGVTVVAEGVETDAQLVELRELGCDGAQGYLFSRPVPEEGVQALLASGSATASC
jgi:EAL domain-containing protein (putative c-di-GMP-specific phosphodiesterase class I)